MKKLLLFIILISVAITKAQIVNTPDVNFKNALLTHNPVIDVNDDGEISLSEASDFSGTLNVSSKNIVDLTGIEAFINLSELVCFENNLNSLDVSNNFYLSYLNCSFNQLSSLDVSNNTNLTTLWCSLNQLSSLDVSNNTNLTTLFCDQNQLNSLNVSNNTNLTELYCYSNQLSSLDISNNMNLTFLNCKENQLSSLDFSNNTYLGSLHCYANQLTNLDVSNNTDLIYLSCYANQLINLDVSNNSNLNVLECYDNLNLLYINLKNDNNDNLYLNGSSNFENLPDLQNVCVDALNTDLTNFITAQTGHTVNFSVNCSTLSVNNNHLLEFLVYPTPTKNILNIISKTEITKIEIYSKLGQKIKETAENQIDISNLTQGLYFVKVEDINGNFGVKKIVKK